MALSDGTTLLSWERLRIMKRISSDLVEVIDPTGAFRLWLRPDLVSYAYEDGKNVIVVGYQSEEFKVSRQSWDLLRRSMSKSLTA